MKRLGLGSNVNLSNLNRYKDPVKSISAVNSEPEFRSKMRGDATRLALN